MTLFQFFSGPIHAVRFTYCFSNSPVREKFHGHPGVGHVRRERPMGCAPNVPATLRNPHGHSGSAIQLRGVRYQPHGRPELVCARACCIWCGAFRAKKWERNCGHFYIVSGIRIQIIKFCSVLNIRSNRPYLRSMVACMAGFSGTPRVVQCGAFGTPNAGRLSALPTCTCPRPVIAVGSGHVYGSACAASTALGGRCPLQVWFHMPHIAAIACHTVWHALSSPYECATSDGGLQNGHVLLLGKRENTQYNAPRGLLLFRAPYALLFRYPGPAHPLPERAMI
jgi:hypothetical protein